MPNPARTRRVTAAQVRAYAGKAQEYVDAARNEIVAQRYIAATSLAIHAAINAADAVCGVRVGRMPEGRHTTRFLPCSVRLAATDSPSKRNCGGCCHSRPRPSTSRTTSRQASRPRRSNVPNVASRSLARPGARDEPHYRSLENTLVTLDRRRTVESLGERGRSDDLGVARFLRRELQLRRGLPMHVVESVASRRRTTTAERTSVSASSSGHVDDVDVSGRTMVLSLVSPKLMVEGNWRAGLVFDADTSDDQMERLTSVFTGALGGPMAGLAPLIGEFLGAERADIELESTSDGWTLTVGGDTNLGGSVVLGPEADGPVTMTAHHRPSRRTDADDHAITGGSLVIVRNRVLGRVPQRVHRAVQLGRLTR